MSCDTCGGELRRDDSHVRCQSCIDKLKRIEQRRTLSKLVSKIFGANNLRWFTPDVLDKIIDAVENPELLEQSK